VKAAAVRVALEEAGMEIAAACSFSIFARGHDGIVHALEYSRGWRLANAKERPTKVAMAKRPEDVVRYCSELSSGGAR
jgi:hypothetical protein